MRLYSVLVLEKIFLTAACLLGIIVYISMFADTGNIRRNR